MFIQPTVATVGLQVFFLAALFSGSLFINAGIGLQLIRWAFENLSPSAGTLGVTGLVRFEDRFWAYLGWTVLLLVSFYTVIGWPWAMVAMMRWACQNVFVGIVRDTSDGRRTRGGVEVVFVGSAWEMLWRGYLVALVTYVTLGLAYPWVGVWLIRWYARNVIIKRDLVLRTP